MVWFSLILSLCFVLIGIMGIEIYYSKLKKEKTWRQGVNLTCYTVITLLAIAMNLGFFIPFNTFFPFIVLFLALISFLMIPVPCGVKIFNQGTMRIIRNLVFADIGALNLYFAYLLF